MNLQGSWKNRETGEIIRISETKEKDVYLLEYEDKDFYASEKIWVKIRNEKKAKITYSLKFGKCRIKALSAECLKIGNDLFDYSSNVPDQP